MSTDINEQVLGIYQNYPTIFDNNIFQQSKEEYFADSISSTTPSTTPSTQSYSNKIINISSPNIIISIIFAIIISLIIIGLNYGLFMSVGVENIDNSDATISFGDSVFDLNIIYQNILLIIMILLLAFIIVIFLKSLVLTKNAKNMFNCEIKPDTYKGAKLVSDLGINENILKKLDIQPTSLICSQTNNKLRDIVLNEKSKTNIRAAILFPVVLIISLILIRIFSDNIFYFLVNGLNGFFKYGLFIFLTFSLIGLNIAVGNQIISNKLAFNGNLSTFQDKINKNNPTTPPTSSENHLTSDEMNELKNKLTLMQMDENSLIISQESNKDFELNKRNNLYDGLIIFTHTTSVILFICISLICLIKNPFNSFIKLFDLSSDLILKIIFCVLIFIPFVGLSIGSIMYPSLIANDVSDSILLTSSINPSIGAIIAIILSIIVTYKGGSSE